MARIFFVDGEIGHLDEWNAGELDGGFVGVARNAQADDVFVARLLGHGAREIVIEIVVGAVVEIDAVRGDFFVVAVVTAGKPFVIEDFKVDPANWEAGLIDGVVKGELVAVGKILDHLEPDAHGLFDLWVVRALDIDGGLDETVVHEILFFFVEFEEFLNVGFLGFAAADTFVALFEDGVALAVFEAGTEVLVGEIGLNEGFDTLVEGDGTVDPDGDVVFVQNWMATDFDFAGELNIGELGVFDLDYFPGFGFKIRVVGEAKIIDSPFFFNILNEVIATRYACVNTDFVHGCLYLSEKPLLMVGLKSAIPLYFFAMRAFVTISTLMWSKSK